MSMPLEEDVTGRVSNSNVPIMSLQAMVRGPGAVLTHAVD